MKLFCYIVFSTSVVVQPWGLRIRAQESKCIPTQGSWRHMAAPDPKLPAWGQYEWVPQGECEMAAMSFDRFCKFMDKSKLDHIMFVGDSLSAMMAGTFMRLVGVSVPWTQKGFFNNPLEMYFSQEFAEPNITETDDPTGFKNKHPEFEQQFHCPTNIITVAYHRNDRLDPSTKQVHRCEPKHGRWGLSLCYPWWDSYLRNAKKTLLVANTGLHHRWEGSFHQSFDAFFRKVSHIDAGMVVFRLSAPGHEDCSKHTEPFRNESEFKISTIYSWNLIPRYNEYAKGKFQELQNPKFKILDVYGMSILRPDGHASPPKDCLHYKIPGVADWWNHLLMTELEN